MPTIIDSLLMELGLDNTKFKEGIKESDRVETAFKEKTTKHGQRTEAEEKKAEAERTRRHREKTKQHKETIEHYKKLREDLIKFFLIFTAGKEIGEFISETVKSTVEIGHLSAQTEVAVDKISGLQVAFKEVGGSAEDANAAIAKASAANADFFAGRENPLNTALYEAASGTSVDLRGAHIKGDPLALMKAQADIINDVHHRYGAAEAYARAGRMGISGTAFAVYEHGGAALGSNIDRGSKLTGINKHQAEVAARFNKEWTDMMERLMRVGRSVLMPMLEEVTKWMGNKDNLKALSATLHNLAESLKKIDFAALGKGLAVLTEGLITIVAWISNIVSTIQGKNAMSGFNNSVDNFLPSFMGRLFDQIDIITGTQEGIHNSKNNTTTFHIGTQNIVVPDSAVKDKRLMGKYVIDAMQANSN